MNIDNYTSFQCIFHRFNDVFAFEMIFFNVDIDPIRWWNLARIFLHREAGQIRMEKIGNYTSFQCISSDLLMYLHSTC